MNKLLRRRNKDLLAAKAMQPTFKIRPQQEEDKVLKMFIDSGLDKEDSELFKLVLDRSEGEKVDDDFHISLRQSVSSDAMLERPNKHITESARTEGYYKIDPTEKKAYLEDILPPEFPAHTRKNMASKKKVSLSRSRLYRASHRRRASVFSKGVASTDIHKLNQLKRRNKEVKFSKSKIHGWGLFTMEDIAANDMVIEYVGEVIRSSVADAREKKYEAAGIGSIYLFKIDEDHAIDATKKGNSARFINHSCDPNCYVKVIKVGLQKKIVLYSKRDIKATEELTYDYKFPIEEKKIACFCGAPNCRGTLN